MTTILIQLVNYILPRVPGTPPPAVPEIPSSRSRGFPRKRVLAGLSNLSLKK